MTRVAIVSQAPVGHEMSSPGIRAFQLARVLARDFEVALVAPSDAGLRLSGVEIVAASGAGVTRALNDFDAVVAQRLPAETIRRLARSRVRVIFDLYTPWLAESLASLAAEPDDAAPTLLVRAESALQELALASGDAFVCTSERQRDFWIGRLAALGRVDLAAYRADRTLRDLIDVVPFGVPPQPPAPGPPALKGVVRGIGKTDRVLLWAGGILNWTDPLTVIRAVERLSANRDDVRLVFLGFDEAQGATARAALDLAHSLGLADTAVFLLGWVPYEERDRYLLESDLGVAAYRDTFEARLAFRARLLDYFWAGLPVVTTLGDELGALVAARGIGRAVAFGDVDAWAEAVPALLDDRAEYERAVKSLAGVREEFSWDRVVDPLRRLLAVPGAPGRAPSARLAAEELWARLRVSYAQRGPVGLVRHRLTRTIRRG